MSTAKQFLEDFQSRPLKELSAGLKSEKLVLGKGEHGLEVAVLSSDQSPKSLSLKQAYKKRKNHRPAPVLLIRRSRKTCLMS